MCIEKLKDILSVKSINECTKTVEMTGCNIKRKVKTNNINNNKNRGKV